jgi:hypothetical protein
MDIQETILITLSELRGDVGEIKGKLAELPKLNERVGRLEMWQSWLKGGWFATASAFLWKMSFGR